MSQNQPPPAADAAAMSAQDLAAVLLQIGPELLHPLVLALERLKTLQGEGETVPAAALARLREPLRRARDAALMAHQIGRLGSGRVRPAHDRLPLHALLEQICTQRRREASARGLQLRAHLTQAEVQGDPTLLPSLVNALLDWALNYTRSSIDLHLDLTPWPVRARLQCRFAVLDLDQTRPPELQIQTEGLRWMLVEHTATSLGVAVRREDEGGVCVATLDFPVPRLQEVLDQLDLGPGHAESSAHNTQPFAGWHVLVVSPRPALREQLRKVLEPQGWAMDTVNSVDEAFQHCLSHLPQAILLDGQLRGPDLEQFCLHVRADAPRYPFIELVSAEVFAAPRPPGMSLCREDQLDPQLGVLLRRALAPSSPDLTLRL